MQVFHLITSLGVGGAQELILQMVRSTDDDISHTVCTVGPDIVGEENELRPVFEDAGARVVNFGADSRLDLPALVDLARFFRQADVDVLHAHSLYSNIVTRFVGRVTDASALISTHHVSPDTYHPALETVDMITTPLDSVTVAVSSGVERRFVGNRSGWLPSFEDQWETVHNGIDVEGFVDAVESSDPATVRNEHDIARNATVYLSVGRYVPAKAHSELIEAALEVVASVPEFKLLLVGYGELEDALREQVSDYGLVDSVAVTGFVEEVHPYYAEADVFVASSRHEGLPMTHLEAMSAGLPVVATDVPGVGEVIDDGRTGLLVPPAKPNELADAMLELSEEPRRRELGREGRRRAAAEFDIQGTVDEYVGLYESTT